MAKFRYVLTDAGVKRCVKNEFYLQKTSTYKGFTERIFRLLRNTEKPLMLREISNLTGIKPHSVNGVITFNIYAGYIKRIPV